MKKYLVFGIIILLVGVNVSGDIDTKDISSICFDSNILYVGGSGPGNYTTIQSAIDDAMDGDTVFVYNGTYYEHVTINSSIILKGEDKNFSIIDGYGSGNVVTIYNDNVTVNGFTIQGSINPLEGLGYSGINIESNNNIICNNFIGPKNYHGIRCNKANNNTFYRNIFWYNENNLDLSYSNDNNISYNFFDYTTYETIILHYTENNAFYHNDFGRYIIKIRSIKYIDFYPRNNIWIGNFWARPRIFPKPILVYNNGGQITSRIYFEYDMNPAEKPNTISQIIKKDYKNILISIKGRGNTSINASSWTGFGLHIGKLDNCKIYKYGYTPTLRYSYASLNGTGRGRMIDDGIIILEDSIGIFYKRNSLIAQDILPQTHHILCFAKKATMINTYWVI